MKKTLPLALATVCFCVPLFSQEALKSTEEEYYDFLSLTGITERPTLGYRTLSDNEWNLVATETPVLDADGNAVLDENGNPLTETAAPAHVWQHNNLGTKHTLWQSQSEGENWFTRGFDHALRLKIYGPEWYNSYNTAAPYGQNDGALWQGKGYNTSLTGGARLEGFGFEVTIKPQVSFSQNRSFEYFTSDAMQGDAYAGKADTYGYFWNTVDAPQRFGNKAFWTFSFGDSEIRWSWRTFTIGFGTQSPWIGPAWLNPILHSNNAAPYPKLDIGLRKTEIKMPYFGWSLGYIEGRIWTGYLSESDYFDNDTTNDHNMFHGLSVSYSPSFITGLTLGLNRVCLSKWALSNMRYILPSKNNTYVGQQGRGEDQKISLTMDWLFPKVGFEVYGELGMDDGTPDAQYLRTAIYTVGLKKTVPISKKYGINGELILEWNNTEMTQDFQFQWPYNFGFHYQMTQGYTNGGQWLGSGLGYGGDNKYIGFRVYHKYGSTMIFYQKANIDSNYIYSKAIDSTAADDVLNGQWPLRHYRIMGIVNDTFIKKNFFVREALIYNDIRRYLFKNNTTLHDFIFQVLLKYNF